MCCLICTAATAVAQSTVKGRVLDSETGDPLIGAAILVQGTSQGSVTDIDGFFEQKVPTNKTIVIRYLGYKDINKKITKSGLVNLGDIKMDLDAVALADVTITSSIAVARQTPVALSSVDPVFIEEKLGTQEFPEILKATPGVYATKQGGGFGDSKINMRGFTSENVAVMVNGVPMNDMEWGGVYWSNWAGLSDVTRSMQTQRGLGASKVAAPSVGGSINVITRTIDAKKGGSVSYAVGDAGYNKMLFTVSTGLTESGWALTLLGGKTWGDGYIQGTEFEGYNYFINLAKRINDNHQLSFTAFGAPQWHNQRNRNDGLSIEGWQTIGKKYMGEEDKYKYNPTYGFGINGERKTSQRNEYHKPQISLNHLWQIDNKSSLSTALYVSIGKGGGYAGQGNGSDENKTSYRNMWYGTSSGKVNTHFRNPDGTFAYDQIYDVNQASENGSKMVMSKSINEHQWYGLLSTYNTKLGENFDLYAGLDLRYYKGIHKNKIIDLYGGDYYLDESRNNVKADLNHAAVSPDFKNEKLQVGDVVYRDYDGYVHQEGVFGQIEYNKEKISAFVAGSLSNTGYWRYDRFYYDKDNAKSPHKAFLGGTIKGGLNYNIDDVHNVFFNAGYISRAPYFSGGVFLQNQTSNAMNSDPINEKVISFELGYGFNTSVFSANVNLYNTLWKNKTMVRSLVIEGPDRVEIDRATINMSGVNARHQGVEVDFKAKPLRWLEITGMFSLGNWKWVSNPKGYYYNSQGQPLADIKSGALASAPGADNHVWSQLNLKNVKVGGSAQTTAALGASVTPMKGLRLGVDYLFIGRNYADWKLQSNNLTASSAVDFSSPWRIPAAHVFDLNSSYKFKIGGVNATISGNINNLFDQEYITDATDNGGNWESAYGIFYGFGRTYNVRLKLNF